MRRVDLLLEEYGQSHQNKINIAIHTVAVPAIFVVTIGLFWCIPTLEVLDHYQINWAHVLVVPALWYYFKLSGPIGAAMTLMVIVSFIFVERLDKADISVLNFSLILFIVMWILQFIGHHIEGKKPSFLKDLQFLLIGPAWWWGHWLRRFNIQY